MQFSILPKNSDSLEKLSPITKPPIQNHAMVENSVLLQNNGHLKWFPENICITYIAIQNFSIIYLVNQLEIATSSKILRPVE